MTKISFSPCQNKGGGGGVVYNRGNSELYQMRNSLTQSNNTKLATGVR